MTSQLRGVALMLCATMLIALSTLQAKTLGSGNASLSPFQITWGRYCFGLVVVLIVFIVRRKAFVPAKWPLHMARVGCGWAGVTCLFAASSLMPLGDATAISFTNPILAMLFAIPLLGEKVGPIRLSCALVAMFGALLLIRPGAASFQPVALIALAAAVLFAFEVIFLKMLAGREGVMQVVLIANAVGALISCLVVPFVWQSASLMQWLLMFGTGAAMVCAQMLFTSALRLGDASFILPFSYATLIWATLYDVTLFDTVPSILSLIGGSIIILSGAVLAWRDGRVKKIIIPSRPSA